MCRRISLLVGTLAWLVGGLIWNVWAWAGEQDVPFDGIVVPQKVPIRAGAGRTFYVVGELKAGDRVRVDEVFFEWYKIAATPHTFSYVSKAFVNAEGDGKLGVINKDRTPVKAASINGPGESYRRQLDLMKDDTVKIVGEEGSFYQIVPFTDSYVFLPPQSVRPATKTELGRHAPSRRAETEFPVESIIDAPKPDPPSELVAEVLPVAQVIDTTQQPPQEGPTPTSVVKKPTATPTGPKAALHTSVQPASGPVKAAEEKMIAALQLPLERQPIEALRKIYEGLAEDRALSPTDRQVVAARLAQLKRNVELAAAIRQITQVRSQLTPVYVPAPGEIDPQPTYRAVGRLLASGVYDGRTLPRLYRLVDPSVMRTLVYVKPNTAFDPQKTLGKVVGVLGPSRYDPVSNLRIIDLEQIDVLERVATSAATTQ